MLGPKAMYIHRVSHLSDFMRGCLFVLSFIAVLVLFMTWASFAGYASNTTRSISVVPPLLLAIVIFVLAFPMRKS